MVSTIINKLKKINVAICTNIVVFIYFTVVMVLYLPVTAGGYLVYGEEVDTNVTMSLSRTYIVIFANILMAVHLILAFLIVINPVCQELEEIFNVPHCKRNANTLNITYLLYSQFFLDYHWKRCVLRTLMVFVMVFIGETIPRFGKILSLVGGSTITLLTFVLPPYFYMRLCQQRNPMWPERCELMQFFTY